MGETSTNKVVTTENLGTFKTQMEAVIDEKVSEAVGSIVYATEQDILDLFAETSVPEEGAEE